MIKRYEVVLGQIAPIHIQTKIADSGLVIINADGEGVTEQVAKRLLKQGYQVVIMTMQKIVLKETNDLPIYPLPTLDEADIVKFFGKITADYPRLSFAGFIHIGSTRKATTNLFHEDETAVLKTVFLSAKNFFLSNRRENSFFISAVRMDGNLGLQTGENLMQGGLFGLHKSLSIEWEDEIWTKAVDLAAELSSKQAADYLIEEIFETCYSQLEVGRGQEAKRFAPQLVETYIDDLDKQPLGLTHQDTLLVTGGGRGITAGCVIHLAKTCGCGFILLGRTDLSADLAWTNQERDKNVLKKLALAEITKINKESRPKPAEIDKLVNMALNQLEIMDTLQAIEEAGGRAVYASCDVRSLTQLRRVVEQYEREQGAITGLIHGAGAIADKKIQRKTAADFELVFGSKIEGLSNCLNALDVTKLKYLILFSSVAGYFGNGGQSDYAMANEVMNKFAFRIKKQQPSCRTVAINWGAWDGGSMVDVSIRKMVKDTELRLIPPEIGTNYFVEQFYQHDNPPQILINCTNRLIRPKISNLADL